MQKKAEEGVRLGRAYQQINLIDEDDHAVFNRQKGMKEVKELLKSNVRSKEVSIERQPLYYEEVDHQIEEVGIMAIKQVRYVTEREWEKMIALQKNNQQIWKYLEQINRYEKKHQIASKIPRNGKGQFSKSNKEQNIALDSTVAKQKTIKKRGRPRKAALQDSQM